MSELLLGTEIKSGSKIALTPKDRFGHMVIVGPTGCGKTSKIIKPGIWQDLLDIKRKRIAYKKLTDSIEHDYNKGIERIKKKKNWSFEKKQEKIIQLHEKREKRLKSINKQEYIAGLTVVEPKGDLAEDVVKMCKALKLYDYKYINPLNENTDILNIMQGDPDEVAETNRTVLKNLFGRQEQFFALIQETTARNTILLIKKLKGDALDIIDVARALRDEETLRGIVELYEKNYGTDDLVQFFRSEVFGTLKDKYYQFALGLRQQLEDIGGNKYLRRVLIGNSTVNLDKHLEEGGILIVNTCMGPLGTLGDTFGEFVIMHLQNAIFRRPGNEWTRPYHYIWIDEAPRYMNQDLERLLAIGRSYVASANLSIQVGDQLVLSEKKEFAGILLANCRTKIIFGGVPEKDARMFAEEFGKDKTKTKQYTYNYKSLLALPTLVPKSYRTTEKEEHRFTATEIMELKSYRKKAEAIIKYIRDGAVQRPVKVITRVRKYNNMPLEFVIGDLIAKIRQKLWFNLITAKDITEKGVEMAAESIKANTAKVGEKVNRKIVSSKVNEELLKLLQDDAKKKPEVKTPEPKKETAAADVKHESAASDAPVYIFIPPETGKAKSTEAKPETRPADENISTKEKKAPGRKPKTNKEKTEGNGVSIEKQDIVVDGKTNETIKVVVPTEPEAATSDEISEQLPLSEEKKPTIKKDDWW